MHAYGMCLHHSCVAINIDDQPWEIVTFAMHQTIGVVVAANHANAVANILGNGEFALVEMLVNRFAIKRKYPDHDAANLVVPSGDIFVFAGEDRDDVTLLRISTNVVDGS